LNGFYGVEDGAAEEEQVVDDSPRRHELFKSFCEVYDAEDGQALHQGDFSETIIPMAKISDMMYR